MADAKDLRAVLDVIREYGLATHVVRVGDIVLQLSSPWGAPRKAEEPKPAPTEDEKLSAEIAPHSAAAARLEKLRELSKAQFGHVYPDKQLEAIAPALLRGA